MTKLPLLAAVFALITSCTTVYNYQVYKTESPGLVLTKDLLVFEDSVCAITYDLWAKEGDPSFLFYNKTNQLITIDLTECFFVMNGISYDYYQNRTFMHSTVTAATKSSSTGVTSSESTMTSNASNITDPSYFGKILSTIQGKASTHSISTSRISGTSITNSRGYSVSYTEQNMLKVPAKTGKVISEFSIVNMRHKDCNLQKDPSNKEKIDSVQYTKETSPFVFSNSITYHLDDMDKTKKTVQNNFYVSSIINMKENQFYYMDYAEGCGRKSMTKTRFYRYSSPKNFYLSYPIN